MILKDPSYQALPFYLRKQAYQNKVLYNCETK